METQGPAAIATAVAVGGVVLLVGSRLLFGEKAKVTADKEEVKKVEETEKPAKKKNKKNKKNAKAVETQQQESKKKAAAEKKRAEEAKKRAEEEAAAKKRAEEAAAKKRAEEEAAAKKKAEEEAAAAAAAKKKKKKKSKAQPPASGPSKEDVEAVKAAQAAAEEAAKAAEEAAKVASIAEDDEWETVTKKKGKKKVLVAPSQDNVEVNVDGGSASVTLDIGDFGPVIIGPSGSRIQAIQSSSGAKVDVDKTTRICSISGTVDQVNNAKAQIIDIIGDQRKVVIELGAKRGLVFGTGGETIRKIQADSGARLELERGSSMCTVSGKSEAVEKARSIIENILNSTNVGTVVLEDKDRPAILGKGGENIRRLQTESGASIELDSDSNLCTITGEPSQVAKAKEMIRLYIEHRGPPPEAVEEMTVNLEHGRLVIGKGGANVTKLQNETGARINIVHSLATSTVTVSGGKGEVAQCVAAINKLIADNSYQETVPLSTTLLVPAIIGEKGAFINKVRDNTNARIDVTDTLVTITGTKQQVGKARQMIQAKIDEELGPPPVKSGEVQHSVDLGSATGKIIGAAGSNISRLEKEYGVSVVVKNGTQCFVTGPKDAVDKVKQEIDDVLERHKEMLEKAKKQEEELRKVAAQNGVLPPADNQEQTSYSGWDVPVLEGSWGTNLDNAAPSAENPWGQPPATNGW